MVHHVVVVGVGSCCFLPTWGWLYWLGAMSSIPGRWAGGAGLGVVQSILWSGNCRPFSAVTSSSLCWQAPAAAGEPGYGPGMARGDRLARPPERHPVRRAEL